MLLQVQAKLLTDTHHMSQRVNVYAEGDLTWEPNIFNTNKMSKQKNAIDKSLDVLERGGFECPMES